MLTVTDLAKRWWSRMCVFLFQWGSSKSLLSVNTTDNVYILTEQIMSSHYRQQVWQKQYMICRVISVVVLLLELIFPLFIYTKNMRYISHGMYFQLAAVQTGPNMLSVHLYEMKKHHDLRTDIQIKYVSCTKVSSNRSSWTTISGSIHTKRQRCRPYFS